MGRLQKNESGFSGLEVLLVLIVVVLIGAVGYMVYKNHKNTADATTTSNVSKNSDTASTASTTPKFSATYDGWNDYCISSVGLCMKYPQNYNLENCADGPSASDCGVESKDVRGSASFPVVSWDVNLASETASTSCDGKGSYTVGVKVPYASDLYISKYTITNMTGFNGEVTYYLLQGKDGQQPSTATCPTGFTSKDGKYVVSISARDGSPAGASISSAQIAANDQVITNILKSFYYK